MAGVSIPASAAKSFSPSRCLSTAWPKIAWWKERRREGQERTMGGRRAGGGGEEGRGERGEVGEREMWFNILHFWTYCYAPLALFPYSPHCKPQKAGWGLGTRQFPQVLHLLPSFSIIHAFNAPYFRFCLRSDSKTEPKSSFSVNKQTRDLITTPTQWQACNSQFWLANVHSEPQQPFLPELNPLKVKVAFSKPVHVARVRTGPLCANQGLYIAKPISCYVHSTLWVTPPTFLCPTQNPHTTVHRMMQPKVHYRT